MPGRPRKSLAEKKLKGRSEGRDSGGRPLPEEPTYSSDIPKPPSTLTGYGLREWKRLAPKMIKQGVLTEADWAVFFLYCDNISHYFLVRKEMAKIKVPNSEWHALDRARSRLTKQLVQLESALGLTPTMRGKVSMTPKWLKDEEAADPMGKFNRANIVAFPGGKSTARKKTTRKKAPTRKSPRKKKN